MPLREAPPMPPKNVSGTLMTRAQGQDTTRNSKARYSQSGKTVAKCPESSGGSKARIRAAPTTTGVYTRAKRVMKASLLDLLLPAFSTSWIILATVLSPKLFVVFILMTPERLTQPEMTSSPTVMSRGRLSPVSATVFRADVPSSITPSSGTFSPGRTMMVSPTAT